MTSKVAVGLVHWPIVDKAGTTVASNITNLDVHDIARASRVYNLEKYYIIHPHKEQLMFVSRLLDFWRVGGGSRYNPMRKTALTRVKLVENIDQAIGDFGPDVKIIGTSAKAGGKPVTFKGLREEIQDQSGNYLILFGTGYGMHEEALKKCHFQLEPIRGVGPDDYRHLSVRSAASICLDRLLGTW